jgi:hypothetical protein
MSNLSVELLAWAKINDHTRIQYAVGGGPTVALTIGGSEGLTLDTTEQGMLNLLYTLAAALQEFRAIYGPTRAA